MEIWPSSVLLGLYVDVRRRIPGRRSTLATKEACMEHKRLSIESRDGSNIRGDLTHVRGVSIQLADASPVISVTRCEFCNLKIKPGLSRRNNEYLVAISIWRRVLPFVVTVWIIDEGFSRRTSMYKSTMSRVLGSRRKDTGSGYTEYKLLARLLAFPAPTPWFVAWNSVIVKLLAEILAPDHQLQLSLKHREQVCFITPTNSETCTCFVKLIQWELEPTLTCLRAERSAIELFRYLTSHVNIRKWEEGGSHLMASFFSFICSILRARTLSFSSLVRSAILITAPFPHYFYNREGYFYDFIYFLLFFPVIDKLIQFVQW